MPSIRTMAALLAATATLSCTDLPLDAGGDSGGDFEIAVGAGTTPVYSWPGGAAFEVSVVRTANQTVFVWQVASPVNRDIAPPVRHGSVPAGALELVSREPTLTRGVEYRVSVKLANGDAAFRDFVP